MIWNDLDPSLPLIWFIIFIFNCYGQPINLIRNFGLCLEWRNLEYVFRVSSFIASFGPLALEGRGTFEACIVRCIHEHRRWSGHKWNPASAAFCWHSPRIFSSGTIFCLCWWPWRGLFSCVLECWLVSLPEHGSRVAELPVGAYLDSAAWTLSTDGCC